jgi:hypothetical protein
MKYMVILRVDGMAAGHVEIVSAMNKQDAEYRAAYAAEGKGLHVYHIVRTLRA